jgi:hypothetical protein
MSVDEWNLLGVKTHRCQGKNLNLKERDLWGNFEQEGSTRYWNKSRCRMNSCRRLKRKVCGNTENSADVSPINLYKMNE